jgi:phosphoheptose isomerase
MTSSLISQGDLTHSFRALLSRASLASVETIRRTRDDICVRELEAALSILLRTADNRGTVWSCGSGSGISSSINVEYQLTTSIPKFSDPVRARALAGNSVSHAAFAHDSPNGPLAAELNAFGRTGIDCLWCFAIDAGDEHVLNAARLARDKLRIPVIAFTGHPGTPLIRFSDAKVQIQAAGEDCHSHRVQEVHTLLYQTLITLVRQAQRNYIR